MRRLLVLGLLFAWHCGYGANNANADGVDFVIRDGSDEIKPRHAADNVLVMTLRGIQEEPYVITQIASDNAMSFFNGHGAKKKVDWDFHAGIRRNGEKYTFYGTYYVNDGAMKAYSFSDVFSLQDSDAVIRIPSTSVSIKINRLQSD